MDSGRTVVDNLLRRKKAERVAVVDSPWSDSLLQWIAEGYPTRMVYKEIGTKRWRPEDGQTVNVEAAGEYVEPVPPWMYFGYDMAGVGGWFDLHPLRGYSEVLEETDEWEVKRNGSGAALKYWKHHMGTPEHMDFLMTSREVWERDYRPHLLAFDVERARRPRGNQKEPGRGAGAGPLDAHGSHVYLGGDAAEHGRCGHVH